MVSTPARSSLAVALSLVPMVMVTSTACSPPAAKPPAFSFKRAQELLGDPIPLAYDKPVTLSAGGGKKLGAPTAEVLTTSADFEFVKSFGGSDQTVLQFLHLPGSWRVIVAFASGQVELWDASSGKRVAEWSAGEELSAIAVADDGERFAAASTDGKVRVFDINAAEAVQVLDLPETLAIDLSADGSKLVTGCRDRAIRVWDVAEKKLLREAYVHDEAVTAVQYLPGGETVLSGNARGGILHWDAIGGREILYTHADNASPVKAFALIPGAGAVIPIAENRRPSDMFHLKTGLKHPDRDNNSMFAGQVAFDEAHGFAARVYGRDQVFFSALPGMSRSLMEGLRVDGEDHLTGVACLPGKHIAACNASGKIFIWGPPPATQVQTTVWSGHTDQVRSVAVTPDGAYAITGSADLTARVWDVSTGKALSVLPAGKAWNYAVAISADGKTAATAADGKIKLWDAKTGKLKGVYALDAGLLRPVFLQGGDKVVVFSTKQIVLLSAADASELSAHRSEIMSIKGAWLLDDGRLVTCSQGTSLHFWDFEKIEETARFELQQRGSIGGVTPDGKQIVWNYWVRGTRSNHTSVFDLESGTELADLDGGDGELSPGAQTIVNRPIGCGVVIRDFATLTDIAAIKPASFCIRSFKVLPGRKGVLCLSGNDIIRLSLAPEVYAKHAAGLGDAPPEPE